MLSVRDYTGIKEASISIKELISKAPLKKTSKYSLRHLIASFAINNEYIKCSEVMGPLGYYRSNVIDKSPLYTRQYSGGEIKFLSADESTETFVRYTSRVSYKGFYCKEKQTDSVFYPANEPYFIISVFPKFIPQKATTYMSREYKDVDDNESTNDIIGIWEGPPEDIVILVVGMEHDTGDREKFKQKVHDLIQEVGSALSEDMLGDDFFRMPKWLDLASGFLAEGVHRIFGMGDDLLGIDALALRWNELQAIADPFRPQNATLSLTGHGAHYEVYFEYETDQITRNI